MRLVGSVEWEKQGSEMKDTRKRKSFSTCSGREKKIVLF